MTCCARPYESDVSRNLLFAESVPPINVFVRQGVVYDTDARAPAARRPSPFSNGAVRRQVVAAPRFTIGAQRGAFQVNILHQKLDHHSSLMDFLKGCHLFSHKCHWVVRNTRRFERWDSEVSTVLKLVVQLLSCLLLEIRREWPQVVCYLVI